MPEYSQDFKELQELLNFCFAFQTAIIKSLEDKEFTFSDAGNLWPLIISGGPAFKNLGNPIARFRNLPSNEKIVLVEWARGMFDLPDHTLEYLIEDTIEELVGDVNVAKRWQKYFKPPVEATAA